MIASIREKDKRTLPSGDVMTSFKESIDDRMEQLVDLNIIQSYFYLKGIAKIRNLGEQTSRFE